MEAENSTKSLPAEQADRSAESPSLRYQWLPRLAQKIRWRAQWLLPNVEFLQDKAERTYSKRIETEDNDEFCVPEEEMLRIRVIWGVEFFGPGEIDSLYKNLHRFNWHAGYGRPSNEAVDWIRYQRAYGGAGAWYNIGIVADREDRNRFPMVDNFIQMPEGVDYLLVRMYQVTTSLSCVLVGFVLEEAPQRAYEAELRKYRKTIRERSAIRSISIVDPARQKERSIEEARAQFKAIASTWFSSNLSGIFCSSRSPLPTAELITTENKNLVSPTADRPGWCRLLLSPPSHDVWTSSEAASLIFAIEDKGWTKQSFHLITALCTSETPDETLAHWGGHKGPTYVAYCHEKMAGILCNYASLSLLKEFSSELRTSRAALALGSASRRKTIRMLEKIQVFFDRSLGFPAIVAELLDRSKQAHYYKHECEPFLSSGWKKGDNPREFAVLLRDQKHFLAAKVISEEHSLREHFEQLSTILSVRESVRAQKRMEKLTFLALAIAAASLFVALPPIENWSVSLRPFLHELHHYFPVTRPTGSTPALAP